MYQSLIVVGNLGKEPEMRYLTDGKAIVNFSLAVADGFSDKKKTIWFRVSAWGKLADTCHQYLHKGSKVLVEGRLTAGDDGGPRIWTRQDGTPAASFEMSAVSVRFLSPKGDQQPEASEEVPF